MTCRFWFGFVFSCLVLSLTQVRGQDAEEKLWPHGAPGAIDAPNYHEGLTYWNGDKTWPLATRISEPALEIFRPHGKNSGTAVLVFPGGGYTTLNFEKEGRVAARWLSSLGITAVVVRYRLPSAAIMRDPAKGPLIDAQAAIRFVRQHAPDWGAAPDRVGVMGFSMGGHVAALASTLYSEKTYTPEVAISARPDFAILVYPVISMMPEFTPNGLRHDLLGEHPGRDVMEHFSAERQVTVDTPPAFLVHARDDQAVSFHQSELYAAALRSKGVSVDLRLYDHGNHGFGLGATKDWPRVWPEDLQRWLVARGLLMP